MANNETTNSTVAEALSAKYAVMSRMMHMKELEEIEAVYFWKRHYDLFDTMISNQDYRGVVDKMNELWIFTIET